MLRFRNPGTQFSTQIQVLKELYKNIGDSSFELSDMANIIAKSKLLTAYGYAGEDALKLSENEQESMNSAIMNAKMYAEVFRMLGWVTPAGEKSYPLVFTYIGVHIATSNGDCSKLFEECVLGINNPTDLTNNMSYSEKVRFFKCVLRTIIDLGGVIYKHELCLGPMSVNDEDEHAYNLMIQKIKNIRGDYSNLVKEFNNLASSLGMKTTPVDNCTRLPIALLKSCGLVETIKDKSLYNKSLSCLKITPYGIELYNKIKEMKDLRLDEFKQLKSEYQQSLIRIGIYSMLDRGGYDITGIKTQLEEDKKFCKDILKGKELLFSPYQTIKRDLIENALGIKFNLTNVNVKENVLSSTNTRNERIQIINNLKLNFNNKVDLTILNENDLKFVSEIYAEKEKTNNIKAVVDNIFNKYLNSTQTVFYPLISTIFKIIGFNCHFSRPGDNGSRWDAIIEDDEQSVPIEIKSPTEELHISIKAIRQALENKIILLSRQTYITTPETTSLAVGYFLPNERAEVFSLIKSFKETYGYKIGVIDFKSLLSIAIKILLEGIGFEKNTLFDWEGLIDATI